MHCEKCGTELIPKFLEYEGMIPFCTKCNEYRFNMFNSAVSVLVFNPEKTKILLIKQYHTDFYRLVAGYVNKGESLEECLYREMGEEIGRIPNHVEFNKSKYFDKSNTLISNFAVTLTSEEIFPNYEVDSYEWIEIDKALEAIREKPFTRYLLMSYLNKKK